MLATRMIMAASSGLSVATSSYVSTNNNASGLTTYTFSGQSVGAAASDRIVMLGVNIHDGSGSISSVTIGGVTATKIVSAVGGANYTSEIWIAALPTGTTADIVVNVSSAPSACSITVWSTYGASSTATDTKTDTVSPAGSVSINCPENGFILATSIENSTSYTWAGVTERVDAIAKGSVYYTSGSDNFETSQTGLTVSATGGGSPSVVGFCAASFGPA